jgi:hypothetical protein
MKSKVACAHGVWRLSGMELFAKYGRLLPEHRHITIKRKESNE